jgi:hypothetical protein
MDFENGVKNIQAAAYNGARTVYCLLMTVYTLDTLTDLLPNLDF